MKRTALITGASRGLGLTLATFLARQGDTLVITARDATALGIAATQLRAEGGRVTAIAGDITDAKHRAHLVRAAGDSLHLLVNNASDLGETPLPALARADVARFHRTLDVNVLAPLALTQASLPLLRASARGLIVNISSDAALGGYPTWGTYGASKAALDLLSKTLAAELKDEGIAVVSVDPGDMRTKMHQDAQGAGVDISDRPLPDATLPFWAWLLGREPLHVTGQRYQAQAAVWEVAP